MKRKNGQTKRTIQADAAALASNQPLWLTDEELGRNMEVEEKRTARLRERQDGRILSWGRKMNERINN